VGPSVFVAARNDAHQGRVNLVAWLGLLLSGGTLIASYVAIAIYSSTPWLWSVIVHESGDRTLAQTILYYEHAARELPLDIILGVAVAGSALFVLRARGATPASRHTWTWCAGLAVACTVIVGGTLWTGGLPMLFENILQYPTRPGEPLVWGGHWRYHLLSHVTLISSSFGLAAPLLLLTGRSRGHRPGLSVFAWAVSAFVALALVFVPGSDSFRNAVFIGHQAREVATHAIVTVPMAWSFCLFVGRDTWSDRSPGTSSIAFPLAAAAIGAIVGVYLLVAALATSAASQGQSESIAVLIFPHFFEHTFSYVVTTLTAGLVFDWVSGRSRSIR